MNDTARDPEADLAERLERLIGTGSPPNPESDADVPASKDERAESAAVTDLDRHPDART